MSPSASLFRRTTGLLLALVLTLSFSAQALAASPSRQVLEVTVNKVLGLLADPAFANPATREGQRAKIETEVRKVFDFTEFSARTAGQRWRSLTPDQQKRFSEAFADLLLSTYLGQLKNYNGEQVRYTGERANSGGSRVEQLTEISMKDGKSIPVAYRMMAKNGTWVVYDILVEGVSLVKNYRTQFQDIMTTASPDDLIRRISDKAQELRKRK